MRIFYPTQSKKVFSLLDVRNRSWVSNVDYLMGFLSRAISPSSRLRRAFAWSLSYLFYPCFYPSLQTQASVKQPLLTPDNNLTKDGRLPVIIFSHGMWAFRTTYTSTCIDVASRGYIVVAVEHLDGSAVIAQYHDHKGKRRWVEHAFSDVPFDDVPMSNRSAQLRQRVGEIEKTLAVLPALDQGLLPQECNVIKGRTSLDVKFLQGRLNLNYLGIHGHSFGAATAIAVCCVDKRFKCCVAEDVWWAPVEETDYEKVAGNVPVLLLNTESFDWNSLQDCRNKFLAARARSDSANSTVTELLTMKGTSRMDQSDFPLLFAGALKRTRMGGKLDVRHAKDINSRASLDFFYETLLPPGTGAPYLVDVVKEDGEHLVTLQFKQSPQRGQAASLFDLSYCANNKQRVLACGNDKRVYVWDRRVGRFLTMSLLASVGGGDLNTLQLSKDEHLVLAGSEEGLINLWDLRGGNNSAAFVTAEEVLQGSLQSLETQHNAGKLAGL